MNRRRMLTGIAAGLPFLSGCAQLLSSDEGTETPTQTTTTAAPTTTTAAPTTTTAAPTTTATQTTTQIATQTATAMPTPTVTGTTSGNEGSASIDPSNLATYTNQKRSYSIKYPAGWTKDEYEGSDSTRQSLSQVSFVSAGGFMLVQSIPLSGVSESSIDPFMTGFLDSFGESFTEFRTTNRRSVSLPNGNTARVVEIRAQNSSTSLRGKALFTAANGTIYDVIILVPESTYTPTVEKAMTEIVTSLTIK